MAGFNVPDAMTPFYLTLQDLGWAGTSSEPDEWSSSDDEFELVISHASSTCTIRYRRKIHHQPGESSEAFYDRRKAAGWNTLAREHGYSVTSFQDWLARSLNVITTWCDSMRLVVAAPGEADA